MKDLIFLPMKLICPNCLKDINTTIEALHDNEELICPICDHIFYPNLDVKKLLQMFKKIENQSKKVDFSK